MCKFHCNETSASSKICDIQCLMVLHVIEWHCGAEWWRVVHESTAYSTSQYKTRWHQMKQRGLRFINQCLFTMTVKASCKSPSITLYLLAFFFRMKQHCVKPVMVFSVAFTQRLTYKLPHNFPHSSSSPSSPAKQVGRRTLVLVVIHKYINWLFLGLILSCFVTYKRKCIWGIPYFYCIHILPT